MFVLLSCGNADKPFTIGDPPVGPQGPVPGTPGGPVGDGCIVNFQGLLQLKASANPPKAGGPFEILDANPFPVSGPIPLKIKGNQIVLEGTNFPDIYFRPPETAADLRIAGAPGAKAEGSYDPATGKIEIDGFQFTLEIVEKGGTNQFLPGEVLLPLADFTTGEVTVSGNLHPITETGQALKKDDRTLVLVTGLVLPTDFTPLTVLNDMIGGGALTARLEGVVDQLPENCTDGGGSPLPPPVKQPKDLHVSIEGQALVEKVDFGTSLVVLRNRNGHPVLDCRKSEFRGAISRKVTIKNVGSTPRVLRIEQPADSDSDPKDLSCSGASEFVRGMIVPQAPATCETVIVGGKNFFGSECTLPPDSKGSIAFPLIYQPYNFQPALTDGNPPQDSAKLEIHYGEKEPFLIELLGKTAPDFRDVFSISRIKDGVVSPKEIRNKGLLKVAVNAVEETPFTQKLVLKNDGTDSWENISITLKEGSGSRFSVKTPEGDKLGAAEGDQPGELDFELVFTPVGGKIFNDTLIITLKKAGQNFETKLEITLLGTVGLAPLKGKIQLHFDFFTALIDHVALSEPIESNDFRQLPEFAPAPLNIQFEDTEDETIKRVTIQPNPVNLLDPSLTVEDRKRILRVFTARASIGKNGERLDPGDDADQCYEPVNILQPYKPGDCSYFYWTDLMGEEGVYDDESGNVTFPEVQLMLQNPYHADIFNIWPASNPFTNPDYRMNTPLLVTFTTHLLDRRVIEENGEEFPLVPDPRIEVADLIVRDKRLGKECPEGFLEDQFPRLRCYLSSDSKYLQGRVVTLRPEETNEYDVIMVGVGRFQPGTTDPDLPWFLGDEGGTRIYIAFQGRLIPQIIVPVPFPIPAAAKK